MPQEPRLTQPPYDDAKTNFGNRPFSNQKVEARANGSVITFLSDMTEPTRLLWSGFLNSSRQFPERPAIDVGGGEVTYRELAERATRIAATIQEAEPDGSPLTAVFAYRSATSYVGVLGALLAGHGYVPLNRTFPVDRTRAMLERSRCRSVIVDEGSEGQLETLLANIATSLILIFPDRSDVRKLAAKFPAHRVIGADDFASGKDWEPVDASANSIAYLLFTSGSTGQPKGVMVSHANVLHYVDHISKGYAFTSEDRVSQTFDMTFDLSAHDLFVAWEVGACVCCPTQKQMIKPGAFINKVGLSVWFSVPSTAVFMRRFGVLKPGMYPRLRLSLFCGEALSVEIARQWSLAAPTSVIENLYGPTELTIACTAYRWDNANSPAESEQGLVPIGEPFDGMRALIVDDQLRQVPDGADGELVMTGPQLSLGYWQDEEKTKQAFVSVPGEDATFYRTGDRVRRPEAGKPIVYLGRLDSQIKILGHRVELGEVEATVRSASGLDGVVAVGWPKTESGADGIEVFLQTEDFDTKALLEDLKARLPLYMVPRSMRLVSRFPLNANGKFDRGALLKTLEETRFVSSRVAEKSTAAENSQ